LYRQAVALIVPSICFEVFGQVIIEAFMERTPAIVRNLGSMPESIEESGGGFVYNTEGELVTAMDQLLTDPSFRRELGLRGYEAYLKKFTADCHLQRYFDLIREVTASKASHLAEV
jgi:glycosyltransferase involved in cell wall biosynthesis